MVKRVIQLLSFSFMVFVLVGCEKPGSQYANYDDLQSFYEVNLRQFGHKGLITNLTEDIDRLYRMSVDAVILPPLQPIGDQDRIDFLGSPFAVKAFTKRDSLVIKKQTQLKDCVKGFHEKKILFLMDWYPLVASVDNEWFKLHPEWVSNKDPKSFLEDPITLNYKGSVLVDIDNPAVQEAIYSAMVYWLETYELDGFRMYNAHQIPNSFWDKYGKKLKKKGALLVAYEENENLHNIFSFSGNFKFLKAGIELYQEKISPKEYLSNLINVDYSPSNRRLLNFTMNLYSNAIEESDIVQLGGLYRPMVGLAFLSGRAFIMTSGQEVPISRSLKLYRYKPIDWQNYLNDDFFRQFILLQKRNKALRYKDVAIQPIETNNENVIGFKKEMDGNVIYGFFNLSFNEQKIILNEGVHGVNHYINNLEINMVKGQEITLPKTQYIILSNV